MMSITTDQRGILVVLSLNPIWMSLTWRLTVNHIEFMYVAFIGLVATMSVFDIKVSIALVVGTWLQYWFAINKSFRVLMLIIVSTTFVSLAILGPVLDIAKVPTESPIRVLVYSLSALISVELVSLIINHLPKAVRLKVEQSLNLKGVSDD
jgi:hypothetical protein